MSAKVPESCTDNVKTIAVFTVDTHTHTHFNSNIFQFMLNTELHMKILLRLTSYNWTIILDKVGETSYSSQDGLKGLDISSFLKQQ